jgi:hypothetical protein
MASVITAEYAAGFFDGEGSVYTAMRYSSKRPCPTVLVSISNTNKEVLDRLHAQWGGSLTPRTAHAKSNPHYKFQHIWTLAPRNAYAFLTAIQPYLIVKKDVVAVALQICEIMRLPASERVDYIVVEGAGRKVVAPTIKPKVRAEVLDLHVRMKELNKRGRKIAIAA